MKRPADIDPTLDWKPDTHDQRVFATEAADTLVIIRRRAAQLGIPWTTIVRRCDTVYQQTYDYDSDR